MDRKTYVVDGEHFSTLEEFYDEIGRVLIPDTPWGRSFDAFHDILRGNFGPLGNEDFTVIWRNSEKSRKDLGYEALLESIKHWETRYEGLTEDEIIQHDYKLIKQMHPKWTEAEIQELLPNFELGLQETRKRITNARQHRGDTLFDWLVSFFTWHKHIELILEP